MIDLILGLRTRRDTRERLDTSDQIWAAMGGAGTVAGEQISESTALSCAAVRACVTILAESIACLPLPVYERLSNGGKRLAVDHPVFPILNREPNAETGEYVFRETLQGHLGTYGNAYAEIERSRGSHPMALWQQSPKPERTKPERREDGRIWYRCRDKHGTNETWVEAKNMLHVVGFGFDGMVGYSPIKHLKQSIGNTQAAARFAGELFANDAVASGHYTHPAKISEDAYNRLKADLTSDVQGRRHRQRILEEGMTYAKGSMSPGDLQLIEARRFGVEDIARAYRIPLHLLQEMTSGTSYASILELGREFLVYTLRPWIRRWQSEINRKLLEPPYFCEFNQDAFLQADPKARAEFYFKMWQMASLTVNDILAKENMNGIGPDGDHRFVPANMMTLDRAVTAGGSEDESENEGEDDEEDDGSEDGEESEKEGDLSAARLRFFLDARARMLRKEELAAKRWAKDPAHYVEKLDAFFEKHGATLADAFLGPVEAGYRPDDCDSPSSSADIVCELVDQHLAASRECLLSLAECPPAELAGRVAGYLQSRMSEASACC